MEMAWLVLKLGLGEIPDMDMANFSEITVPISSLPMAYPPEC
jgi:hypothetical protein